MGRPRCICPSIPRLVTRTRVVIIIHHREVKMPTNTGRLAHLCLVDSRLVVRGIEGDPLALEQAAPILGTPLLLHPTDDAAVLDDRFRERTPPPYTLFVPDGSWRQASKVGSREKSLESALRVKLAGGEPSRYRVRKETKPGGLATIEAIARALGFLEESAFARGELERIFALMVERTLESRGVTSEANGLVSSA